MRSEKEKSGPNFRTFTIDIVTISSCNHWEICGGRRRKYDLLKMDTEGGKLLNQFDRNNGKT